MIDRILVLLAVVWLIVAMNFASAAADVVPPDVLARQTAQKTLQAIREHRDELKRNPAMIYDLVNDLVAPHFDFELMSRLVLAQNWRTATPDQRKRFVDEFRRLLVRTYGKSLSEYSGQTVEFEPMHSDPSARRVTVNATIQQPDGPPIALDYKLYKTQDAGWKVFDVYIAGVSLVLNYRNSFSSEIAHNGLDALIEQLAQRNSKGRRSL
ncbi:MAG: ABC transporter substrate-binding protein [Nitrococcus sp.]|nr:ABC transporter substrate-binding protein [Nitrococcus sp.]